MCHNYVSLFRVIRIGSKSIGPGCAMAADSRGNLLTVGVLGEQRKERSLAVISMADETEPNVVARNLIDRFTVGKLIPFQDNTFVLAGGRNENGLCWKIDNQGNIIQHEQLDLGRDEAFTGLDWLKSDDPCLAVVGLSFGSGDNNIVGMSADNFIVLYDANCKIIREDDFIGWESVSAITLTSLRPKVCQLDNGNIVVVHGKESTDSKRWLWARCYTQGLKLLWEKEIFCADDSPDKLPFYFDLTSCGSKGFVAGILTPLEGLKFYFFNEDGSEIDYTEYKGMVGSPGFNLMRIRGRTIAVFQDCSGPGKIQEITIKAKVIALD